KTTDAVWSDENWTLHPPHGGSLPGAVWLASRVHVDSFGDLPEALASDFGRVAARVERAMLSLGDIARVHLYRWGDGGAHFHVWFIPRPLGMVEAAGMMLPIWEDVLPNVPDEPGPEWGAGCPVGLRTERCMRSGVGSDRPAGQGAMAVEIIGRRGELLAFDGFLGTVPAGGQALLLEGDAGIGKTALWQEGNRLARERGFHVLTSRSAHSETQIAFATVVDVFAPVLEETLLRLPHGQRRAFEIALLLR